MAGPQCRCTFDFTFVMVQCLFILLPCQDRKKWECFRELPEWILSEAATRVTLPLVIIEELANICNTTKMGLNALSNHVKKLRFANAHLQCVTNLSTRSSFTSASSLSSAQELLTAPGPMQPPDLTISLPPVISSSSSLAPVLPPVLKKWRAPPADSRWKKRKAGS